MIFFVFFSLCGYEMPKKNVLVGLGPSIHKYGNVFIHSGLSAALGHELGPDGVSICLNISHLDT